jgi:hypothetical protein
LYVRLNGIDRFTQGRCANVNFVTDGSFDVIIGDAKQEVIQFFIFGKSARRYRV